MFRLTSQTWFDVLGDRPTDALWGIGAKTARRLAGLGIGTVSDLAAADPQRLAAEFGPATGPWLVRLARGQDDSPVDSAPYLARSRGREVTYQADLDDWDAGARRGGPAGPAGGRRDRGGARPAVRVVVKVRYAPFFTESHSRSLPEPGRAGTPSSRRRCRRWTASPAGARSGCSGSGPSSPADRPQEVP